MQPKSRTRVARRSPTTFDIEQVIGWWTSTGCLSSGNSGHLARFERSDHSDVREFLAEHGVVAERILMLAMARTLGYVFNPISVFWCYDAAGARVVVVG